MVKASPALCSARRRATHLSISQHDLLVCGRRGYRTIPRDYQRHKSRRVGRQSRPLHLDARDDCGGQYPHRRGGGVRGSTHEGAGAFDKDIATLATACSRTDHHLALAESQPATTRRL